MKKLHILLSLLCIIPTLNLLGMHDTDSSDNENNESQTIFGNITPEDIMMYDINNIKNYHIENIIAIKGYITQEQENIINNIINSTLNNLEFQLSYTPEDLTTIINTPIEEYAKEIIYDIEHIKNLHRQNIINRSSGNITRNQSKKINTKIDELVNEVLESQHYPYRTIDQNSYNAVRYAVDSKLTDYENSL